MKKGTPKILLIVFAAIVFVAILFFSAINSLEKKRVITIEKNAEIIDEPLVTAQHTEEETTENAEETLEEEAAPSQEINDKEGKKEEIEEEELEKNDSISIKKNLVSWGFETPTTKRTIDTIIIHSSYDALGNDPYDVEGLVNEYKIYGVSAHYLIDREGIVYQLVADKNISYHAGQSKVPDGRTGVNYFSLGIELMNTKEDEYTKKQYSSLNKLLAQLKKTYEIKYILGHDEIAPERKTDPWNFDWDKVEK